MRVLGCLSKWRSMKSGIPEGSRLVSSITYKSSGSQTELFLPMLKKRDSSQSGLNGGCSTCLLSRLCSFVYSVFTEGLLCAWHCPGAGDTEMDAVKMASWCPGGPGRPWEGPRPGRPSSTNTLPVRNDSQMVSLPPRCLLQNAPSVF